MTMEHDTNEQTFGGEEVHEDGWRPAAGATPNNMVNIENGRGNAVSVPAGSPFIDTVNRVADEANYGGYFRVFVNGQEIIDPTTAPATLEAGMRVAITAYDKVG